MSSSFVKDCLDARESESTSSNKTVILIVNNDAENINFGGNGLQNLLG